MPRQIAGPYMNTPPEMSYDQALSQTERATAIAAPNAADAQTAFQSPPGLFLNYNHTWSAQKISPGTPRVSSGQESTPKSIATHHTNSQVDRQNSPVIYATISANMQSRPESQIARAFSERVPSQNPPYFDNRELPPQTMRYEGDSPTIQPVPQVPDGSHPMY